MRLRRPNLCERVRDASALQTPSAWPEDLKTHAQSCAACQDVCARVDQVKRAGQAVQAKLDDVTRARMLAHTLAALASAPVNARHQALRWLVMSLPVAVTAALLLWWRLAPETAAPTPNEQIAQHAPATETSPEPSPLTHLRVPAREHVRARFGAHAHVSVFGPAHVTADTAPEQDDVVINLTQGRIVVDFDKRSGRSLRVVTADATVHVVGTRFAVTVTPTGTRVSVERGAVMVDQGGVPRRVEAGLSSQAATLGPLVAEDEALFQRHDVGTSATPSTPATALPKVAQPRVEPGTFKPRASRGDLAMAAPPRSRPGPAASQNEDAPPSSPPLEPPGTASAFVPAPVVPPPLSNPAPLPPAPAPMAQAAMAAPAPALAEALYDRAERLMAAGAHDEAMTLLDRLVQDHPQSQLSAFARFELASTAMRAQRFAEAELHISPLLMGPAPRALRVGAELLRCRLAAGRRVHDEAQACFLKFARAHPDAAQSAEALGHAMNLARGKAACREGQQAAALYLQRFAEGPMASTARAVQASCKEPQP